MDIGRVIRKRREELGLTQDQVAGLAGLSKPYLSNIETGRVKNPPTDNILKSLEASLRFEPGQLTTLAHWERTPQEVRRQHEQVSEELENLRGVVTQLLEAPPAEGGQDGDALRQKLAQQVRQGRNLQAVHMQRPIPVINKPGADYIVRTEQLEHVQAVGDDFVRLPDISDARAFAIRVINDQMEPAYRSNDLVIFSPTLEVHTGDDCFVRFNDAVPSTFMRVYFDTEEFVRLQPLNSRYASQIVDRKRLGNLWPAVSRVEYLKR